MSTHATIAIERNNGTRTAIYLHFDGYIEGAGTTLQLAYNTADKVEKLLELGDLSVLGYCLEGEKGCTAYHRDEGEELKQSDMRNEYNYTFNEYDACWYVEKEVFLKNTKASKMLEIGYVVSYPRTLLLDEILQQNYDNIWISDEYAENGDEVQEVCAQKAIEARKEKIQWARENASAWYRAYCD